MSNSNFKFGKNWKEYLEKTNDQNILYASRDLETILGTNNIKNKSFLDIGCGSGIHSLSALTLGAKYVESFDLDPINIKNTQNFIEKWWEEKNYDIYQNNILDNNVQNKKFDIIYSWGVLHHTGNLELAIKNSLKYCKSGSILFLALYEKTYYCEIWKKIKKFYNSSNKFTKFSILYSYIIFKIIVLILLFKNPYKHIRDYQNNEQNRGMLFFNDQVDWVGGYPYESITKKELETIVGEDFSLRFYNKSKTGILRSLLGNGCSIYTFEKQ